jgi:hypothetical protein
VLLLVSVASIVGLRAQERRSTSSRVTLPPPDGLIAAVEARDDDRDGGA